MKINKENRLPFTPEVNGNLIKHWDKFNRETRQHLENFGLPGSANTALPSAAKALKKCGFSYEETQDHLLELYSVNYPDSAKRDIRRACELVWGLRGSEIEVTGGTSVTRTSSGKKKKAPKVKVKKWSAKPQPNTRVRNFNRMIEGTEALPVDELAMNVSTMEFLDSVFESSDRIVLSKERRGRSHNRLLTEFKNFNLNSGKYCFVIANPVLAAVGLSQEGKQSTRSKDICTAEGDENILVLENDEQSRDDQLRFLNKLIKLGVPVIAIIDAQNKSLHGWVSVKGLRKAQKENLKRFFVSCGFDPASMRNSQLVRLVGGYRDNDKTRRQNLLYFNKENVGDKITESILTSLDISSYTEEEDAPRSDLDEADRFIHYLGGRFINSVGLGWYEFKGHTWKTSTDASLKQCFLDYVRLERKAGFVVRSEYLSNKKKILDIISLVTIELTRNVTFDTSPWLVGCRNGVLELKTGTLRQGRPSDYVSKVMAVNYDPVASCPNFEAFMKRVFRSADELVNYMQRLCGYTLTGLVKEQKVFFFYGAGANGKTTLINVLQGIMGGYSRRVQEGSYLAGKYSSSSEATLEYVGARFAYGEEMPQSARLDEASVKNLSGGDMLLVKMLYKDRIEVAPTHKLYLFGNHKPRVTGLDHGIWRRLVIIPFQETIGDDEKNSELPEILEKEYSGILNWFLLGLQEYLKEGLGQPKIIDDAVSEYKNDEDIFGEFITQYVDSSDCKARTSKSSVYEKYCCWCKLDNAPVKTRNGFHKAMRERGLHPISNSYPFALKTGLDADLFCSE